MKKIALISVLMGSLVTANAFADANNGGFYLGLGLGASSIANNFYSDNNFKTLESEKNTGVAGQVFMGYMFNQYFGVETGVTHFADATAKFHSHGDRAKITENAVDLMGVARYTFNQGFSVFGKLGAALVGSDFSVSDKLGSADIAATKIVPAFALGGGYQVSNHVNIDLQWMRVQGAKDAYGAVGGAQVIDSGLNLEPANLYTVGVTYVF